MQELDLFYLQLDEPNKSCLSTLRGHILAFDIHITEAWKFNMPFFFYKGNRFCYFKVDRKLGTPYLGFNDGKWIDHPGLVFEDRSRIKIFMVDPTKPLPVETIGSILKAATVIYD
ncbi:DUF1801 domain-containing protein [Mucilaginibacter sp.]|jgi:hypothetical protein|uniref:DUF1801 domain-containing protein n=1 Tax=Mucilaginibacter sp. TaxID=1882438 RepID=UPI002CA30BD0|nr:DUF1801 domain-containing protein [Mucilaginibacter sp.]HTI60977.1 DUF1801 domain-containing protein [Mucilaginibacter sp.]